MQLPNTELSLFERKLQLVTKVCSVFVFVPTVSLFFIWLFIPDLKAFSGSTMKVNTSLGLALASLALWRMVESSPRPDKYYLKIEFWLSVCVFLIGALTGFQYVLGIDLGIDQLLVADFPSPESQLFMGRMSPIASLFFVLLGIDLISSSAVKKTEPRRALLFVVPLFMLSMLALIGHIYSERSFYQPGPFIRITWQTALCFNLLSVGIIYSRPRDRLVQILASQGLGGMMARRLLPIVILVPMILGYLWLYGRRAELVDRELGVSLFVLAVISILMFVVGLVSKRLDVLQEEGLKLSANEQALKQRFMDVLSNAPLAVWATDRDGNYLLADGKALAQAGLTSQDLVGKNHFEVYKDTPLAVDAVRRALSGEQLTAEVEVGGRVYLSNYSPVRDSHGQIVGMHAVSNDITELKYAQYGFLMERENLRNLFSQTPEIVCILYGPDHLFEFVNEAHVKVLGFDATGKTVREAQPESVEVHGILDRVYQTGQTAHLHEIGVTVGDRLRWFDLTYSARRNERGQVNGVMILGMEVSSQVKIRRDLKEAIRARDEFLSIASHELKTPLTTLKLQSQMFKKAATKGDDRIYSKVKVDSLVEQIDRQTVRLNRLVDDMLDVSRIRSGKLNIDRERFDLCEVVKETAERLKSHFGVLGRGLPELDIGVNAIGEWDKLRIEQVITNLFTNAIRYGESKPVKVRIQDEGDSYLLSVQDQGIGISKEAQEKIFNRFERAINASEVSGLGLGLFIAKQIVVAHGGRIWVESELGRGSTFFVSLPKHPGTTSARSVEVV